MGTFTLSPGSIDTGIGDQKMINVQDLKVERWISVYDYGNITNIFNI